MQYNMYYNTLFTHATSRSDKNLLQCACNENQVEYFYSTWIGCQSIAGLPSNYLYTWVERVTVRIKCLAQEHNPNTIFHPMFSDMFSTMIVLFLTYLMT